MYDFVDNWSTNPKVIERIKNYIPSYLSQFKLGDQPIICKLLENIEYYDEEKIEEEAYYFFQKIKKIITDLNGITKISTPFYDNVLNHNTSKLLSNCPKSIPIIINIFNDDLSHIDNLIIVDDYSGTGNTFLAFLNKLNDSLYKKIKVIYCPMFITSQSAANISNKKFKNINLTLVEYKVNYALCLSENSIFLENEIKQFINICEEKNIKYIHGYENVEDIISTKYFTPNNSLGILWYSERLYKPLFNRNGQNLSVNCRYLSNKQIDEFRKIIKVRNSEKIKIATFALLLYNGYEIDEIEKFLRIDDGKYIFNKLIDEEIIILKNNKYYFYKNLDKYFNENALITYIGLGQSITKQEIIENGLRSLIS